MTNPTYYIDGLLRQPDADDARKYLQIVVVASAAPANPFDGQVYLNSTDHHFYGWNGSVWKQLDN